MISDQVRHKPGCAATEDGKRLVISDLEEEGVYFVVKTKALISCIDAVQLICAFVFTYAKSRFSSDATHLLDSMGMSVRI